MNTLLIILAAILLSSCARVTVQTETTPTGTDWDITYSVFGRKLEDLNASVGDIEFSLGKAGNDIPISNDVVACLLSPHLCK